MSEIIPLDAKSFNKDLVYLWVLHADKVPPHIGISSQGKYFSLKSNGKDENLDWEIVKNIVDRKNIKTLLFELDRSLSAKEIEVQFSRYHTTETGSITCLDPLKNLLSFTDARMLKDLLADLNTEGSIISIYGLNIDNSFKGLVDYSVEDIHARLRKLENA